MPTIINLERYKEGYRLKIGRNDPCPCGSGKKYKKCCLRKNQFVDQTQNAVIPAELTSDFEHIKATSKKINDLFQDFRAKKIHMAIVVDEYGGTSGLVTMEDIVEEIVGDISDEFDKEPENDNYKKIDDSTYIFKAQISLIDFCKILSVKDNYFEEIEGRSFICIVC